MKKDFTKEIKLELGIQLLAYITMLVLLSLGLPSCSETCEVEHTYTYYEPVYTPLSEVRNSVESSSPIEVNTMGKLYVRDHLLFINEPNEGVHIYDNQDPSNPINLSFINIPGNFDLAVYGNILYADSYMDLVAIDISDVYNAKEVGRLTNLYDDYNSYGFYVDSQLGVVTDWAEVKEITMTESSCADKYNDDFVMYSRGIAVLETASFDASNAVSPTNPGMGGSMARMTIGNDHLYALANPDIVPVSILNPSSMSEGQRLDLDWSAETLFPRGNELFVGSMSGMHILDITSPMNPSLISTYSHISSCDPVVVDGDIAYVTLRSGNTCQSFTNQLEVIDISNLSDPQLLYTYEMYNPHGLGKDDNTLFVCDGDEGLKIYDATNNETIDQNLLINYRSLFAYDVIPYNGVAMMIATDGLYQYDYTNINDIKLLSKIAFTNAN